MSDKIALFTTANSNYIQYAVRCFEIFNSNNPGVFDFYIITSEIVEFESKIKVQLLLEDLHEVYKIEKDWPYPSECLWLFKGPNIFDSLGYKYSMYTDCDVVNFKPLDFSFLKDVRMICGTIRKNRTLWKDFTVTEFLRGVDGAGFLRVKDEFNIVNPNGPSINSGVLIFNNPMYVHYDIFNLSTQLFDRSKNINVPRKGDDSLLSLIIAVTDPELYTYLHISWNDYYEVAHRKPTILISEVKNLHMAVPKPWKSLHNSRISNPVIRMGFRIWNQK